MAVLSEADRQIVTNRIMQRLSETHTTLPAHLKSHVKAAVDATDDWQNDNAAAFNTALPVTTRNNANAAQKAYIFDQVALRRREVS